MSAPETLGPYDILYEIGSGGFGAVYRARHRATGAEVALKVPGGEALADPVQVRRFLRESELAREIEHPGIVRALDSGEDRGRAWFAMELIEGESLHEVVSQESLPWERAARIAREVADALAAAHAKGILHRDVKPGNILLDRAGVPHLTDFGLAKDVATGSRLTRTGVAVGTPEYMSPEQARGEVHDLGPATDVWGVGVVLYQMLAGRKAFDGESPESVVEKVILREPAPLRRLRPDVPKGLVRVVRVCLAKAARDRYRDAGALRDDLDRVLRGERPVARPPRARGRRAATAALAAAAIAAAVSALWAGPPPSAAGAPQGTAAEAPLVSAAERLAARARAAAAGDPAEAARLFAEALAADAGYGSRDAWRLERGLLLWAVGDGPAARVEWDSIPVGSAEWTAGRFWRGLEALGRLDAPGARPDLEAAARGATREARLARAALDSIEHEWLAARERLRGEEGWEAALLRGYVETHDPGGDAAAAIREYGVALAGGILFGWVLYNRASLRNGAGDPAGALEDLAEGLRRRPDWPEALNLRATMRAALGDLHGALADLTEALRLRPTADDALSNRGNVRRHLGDLAGALADCDAAVGLDPCSVAALTNRGLARAALGDAAGAIRDFDAALRLRPGDLEARWNRGGARAVLGDAAGAAEDFTECLRLGPGNAAILYNRASARHALGDRAGALADLDEAIRLRPDFPDARLNRGNARWDLRDRRGALEDFTEALRLRPNHPLTLANRALLGVEMGDLAGAEEDAAAALRLRPEEPGAHSALGRIRAAREDWEGAAAAFREYLRLAPGTRWAADIRRRLAACEEKGARPR